MKHSELADSIIDCLKCGMALEEEIKYAEKVFSSHYELLAELRQAKDVITNLLNEIDPQWRTQFDGGQEFIDSIDNAIKKAEE